MRLLPTLLLALTAGLSSAAQPSARPATFRLIAVKCSVAGLGYEPAPRQTTVPVSLSSGMSPAYLRPVGSQLELFEEIPPPPDAPPGAKPTRHIVLSATLPGDVTSCLLIVTASPQNAPLPLTAVTLTDDAKTHPNGSLRVINLAGRPAAVAIDSQSYELDAHATRVIPLTPSRKFMQFRFGGKHDGGWTLIHEDEYRFRPQYRGYAIIKDATPPQKVVDVFFERAPPPPGTP